MKRLHSVLWMVLAAGLSMAAETGEKQLEIGQKAPAFELPGVDGKTYSLDDFADAKILAVIFTCNHCPTAQAYEDKIQKMAEEYKDKGVAFVAISPNDDLALRLDELGYTDLSDSFEEMKIRAKDKGFTFPYLYAGDREEISRAYGPTATPHVYIFDAERSLRYKGRIDDNEREEPGKETSHDTRNAIEALLAGADVPEKETKSFGCSIKWSDKRGSVKEFMDQLAKEEVTVKPASLDDVKNLVKNDSGKLRLINVWATHCGPCVAEFPELVEINRMYRHRDFELVTLSADSMKDEAKVLAFLKKQQASTANYQFSGDDVYKLIEAVDPKWEGAIPYTLLVNAKGEVIFRHMGAIDPLEVKKEIVNVIGRTYK